MWVAYKLYPHIYHKDVLGSVHDFSDCTVLSLDAQTGALVPTNETIEVAAVDHDIQLVQAKTFDGAMYGLGFVHAKHRLFQLHLIRLVAQGRLSELIGSQGVGLDRYVRQVGVLRALEARLETLPAEDNAVLLNYAAGINKVAENLQVYPWEFHILFTSFEPWTVKDSVACQYFFSALVSVDWFAELLRVRLLEVYDRDVVD